MSESAAWSTAAGAGQPARAPAVLGFGHCPGQYLPPYVVCVSNCAFPRSGCKSCGRNLEQYCPEKRWTYNSKGMPTRGEAEAINQGGYSTQMVVDYKFCFRIPKNLPLDAAAPLLCGAQPWPAVYVEPRSGALRGSGWAGPLQLGLCEL